MEELDKWDRVYIRDMLRGFQSLLTRHAGETVSQYELIAALRKRLEVLESERASDMAKIGELSARVDAVETRVEKMAEWLKKKLKPETEVSK
jgi:uncharacterized coiled-coil protein SlyX